MKLCNFHWYETSASASEALLTPSYECEPVTIPGPCDGLLRACTLTSDSKRIRSSSDAVSLPAISCVSDAIAGSSPPWADAASSAMMLYACRTTPADTREGCLRRPMICASLPRTSACRPVFAHSPSTESLAEENHTNQRSHLRHRRDLQRRYRVQHHQRLQRLARLVQLPANAESHTLLTRAMSTIIALQRQAGLPMSQVQGASEGGSEGGRLHDSLDAVGVDRRVALLGTEPRLPTPRRSNVPL